MTKAELLAELRSILDDTKTPYGWSDTRLTRFLVSAENQFCKDTGFFVDMSTDAICKLTLVGGQQSYTLDSRIIMVTEVWDSNRKLNMFTEDDRPKYGTGVISAQAPVSYQLDREPGKITFYETVLGGTVLTMRVWRRPVTSLTTATTSEIPVDFHPALAEYAAYKAFSDHDRELQDPVKAGEHLRNYLSYAREGRMEFDRLSNSYHRIAPAATYVV